MRVEGEEAAGVREPGLLSPARAEKGREAAERRADSEGLQRGEGAGGGGVSNSSRQNQRQRRADSVRRQRRPGNRAAGGRAEGGDGGTGIVQQSAVQAGVDGGLDGGQREAVHGGGSGGDGRQGRQYAMVQQHELVAASSRAQAAVVAGGWSVDPGPDGVWKPVYPMDLHQAMLRLRQKREQMERGLLA